MKNLSLFVMIIWLKTICGLNFDTNEGFEEKEKVQPFYAFEYGVKDTGTGDVKNQWEVRKGDDVQGEYSVLDPDGALRTVRYSADKQRGFRATVTREGKVSHPRTPGDRPFGPQLSSVLRKKSKSYASGLSSYRKSGPYSVRENSYETSESVRHEQYASPEVPANHSPVYTGVSDYSKLQEMYKNFRLQNLNAQKHKFDYGMGKYVGKEAESPLRSWKTKTQNVKIKPSGFLRRN